jgi:hypothetical protein
MPRFALLAMTGGVLPDPPVPVPLLPEPELPLPLPPVPVPPDPVLPEPLPDDPDPLLPVPVPPLPVEPPPLDPLLPELLDPLELALAVDPWPVLSPLLPPQAARMNAMAAASNPLQTNDVFFI